MVQIQHTIHFWTHDFLIEGLIEAFNEPIVKHNCTVEYSSDWTSGKTLTNLSDCLLDICRIGHVTFKASNDGRPLVLDIAYVIQDLWGRTAPGEDNNVSSTSLENHLRRFKPQPSQSTSHNVH